MTERAATFRRNDSLEGLLGELSSVLGGAEAGIDLPAAPRRPVLLVVGPPRSGTTLLMQWLAASGEIAFPTNLLSRFYAAPYLGARIQQLLTDPRYNYRDELWAFAEHRERFRSDLGKTRGPLEPNEYWYFWRRFVPLVEPEPLGPERAARVDAEGLRRGLAALETAFERPFAAKGILFQYDLPLVASLLPTTVFLHTVRDRVANARSLLKAREQYWGDRNRWFSVRPPGSERLQDARAEVQVAGQILATHHALRTDLGALPAHRRLEVDHEAFCADPAETWASLRERLAAQGEILGTTPPVATMEPTRPPSDEERARWDAWFGEAEALLAG